MNTTTSVTPRHRLPIGTRREGAHARAVSSIARRPNSRLVPETVIPTMGPANRPPGVPVMGGPSFTGYANAMGQPGAHPGVSVMGARDRGMRTALFGDSDAAFVGSLFGR
jgi:hypothetical protein